MKSQVQLKPGTAPKAPAKYDPPEDSVGIRTVAFLMAILCICVGVAFVKTEIYLSMLYVVFALGGSFLSYAYRANKNNWQSHVVIAGIFLVAVNCWRELNNGLELGDLSLYTPIVHFVAGTFVVQTFELRTRSDINTSQLIGLILLCIVAPIAKSLMFGGCTLVYITLGALLLYYDCLSRTAQSWTVKTLEPFKLEPTRLVKAEYVHSSPGLLIAALPLASIALFFLMPRADGLIDSTLAYVRSFGEHNDGLVQMPPASRDGKFTQWQPRHSNKTEKILSRGKPAKPGAHDDAAKAPRSARPGRNEANQSMQSTAERADKPDDSEKLPADGNHANSGKNIAGKKGGPNSAQSGTSRGINENDASLKGHGTKGKATSTAKEDTIVYDDEMSIQQELNNSDDLLIKIKSNRSAYLRMYVLDTFDGYSWKASDTEVDNREKEARGDIRVSDEPSLQLPSDFPAVDLVQDYSIEHDLSRNVPVAWIPKAVSPNLEKISVDSYGAIRLQEGDLKKGMQFKVVSSFPVYNLQAMRADLPLTQGDEEQFRARLAQYLQMPDDASDQVEQMANQLTSQLPANWFRRTEAIAHYLQKNYSYSTEKIDSENPNDDFLFKRRSGDCKNFATALALLTRSVGIPSRVIAGFAPGELNAMSGFREVRSKHRHVWTEVYLPKYGWVPFDSTPQGCMPDKVPERSYDIVGFQESMQQKGTAQSQAEAAPAKKPHIITSLDIFTVVVNILAVAAIGFFVVRAIGKAMSKRRDEQLRAHPARKLLKQVQKDLRKWKIEKQPADTGTELSARVRDAVADRRRLALPHDTELPNLVEAFMEHYDAAYFGNKDCMADLEKLSQKISAAIGK